MQNDCESQHRIQWLRRCCCLGWCKSNNTALQSKQWLYLHCKTLEPNHVVPLRAYNKSNIIRTPLCVCTAHTHARTHASTYVHTVHAHSVLTPHGLLHTFFKFVLQDFLFLGVVFCQEGRGKEKGDESKRISVASEKASHKSNHTCSNGTGFGERIFLIAFVSYPKTK